MADGRNVVGQFKDEIAETAGEIAGDVKDSVGEALEQGVQSVVGTQLTPQQIQQKQVEDQKKIAEARRKIQWYKDLASDQKAQQQKEKQKQIQKTQVQVQEQQAKQAKEIQQKQSIPQPGRPESDTIREDLARTQMERSKGRGVGG